MQRGDFVRQLPTDRLSLQDSPSLLRRWRLDLSLLVLLALLSCLGLLVLYSASGQNLDMVRRQAGFLLAGFAAMVLVAQFNIERVKRLAPAAFVVGVALLIAVEFLGTGAKGAQRWLSLAGFRFQPSELMKLIVPMMLAWYLARRMLPPSSPRVLISLAMLVVPTLLIARQPDLGTAILIGASGFFVLFLAGLSWRFLVAASFVLIAAAVPIWHFLLQGYQRQRILTLLNPESDKLGAGWNIIQSQTAIGSGGLDGKGWLEGTQSRLDFLPESHTDFIIAVLAEEFGLRGVLVLLLIYLLIILRGLWIGFNAKHSFGRLLGGSITLTFFVYVFVNMGMVAGLLPIVGVPLPLVSQGGTAMLTLMVGFGVLMAIRADDRLIHQ